LQWDILGDSVTKLNKMPDSDYSSPLVSFVVPTYNSQEHIKLCLSSIVRQKYPKKNIEILVIDGGSNDRTLDILKTFPVKIIHNPLRVAEYAKSTGLQQARGEYLVILDSDNEISHEDWLARNVKILETDNSIFGMDTVFLVKKEDFLMNRYCALLGLEDPLVRHLADLSRNSILELHEKYSIYRIKNGRFPIFGSNGFVWRKSVFDHVGSYIPRFDEADFAAKVVAAGFKRIGFIKEVGIYHYHLKNLAQFISKRIRRGNEFMNRRRSLMNGSNSCPAWTDKYRKFEFFTAVFLCLSVVYPSYESIRGYIKTRDLSWFMHPLCSILTVLTYLYVFIRFKFCEYINNVIK